MTPQSSMPRVEIDGSRFDSLDGFFAEAFSALNFKASDSDLTTYEWDLFTKALRQKAEQSAKGLLFVWKNHELSEKRLGYEFTLHWLEDLLANSTNQRDVWEYDIELGNFRLEKHPTVFERLTKVIKLYGPAGEWPGYNVELALD